MSRFRLQLLVNGRVICTAGIGECGSLSAAVSYSYTPPEQVARWTRPPATSDESGAVERCDLKVEGLDEWCYDCHWLGESLRPGDEVVIRVLGPGPADAPESRVIPF